MTETKLPDFTNVEEAEKYNKLAAMGWVDNVCVATHASPVKAASWGTIKCVYRSDSR